MARGGGGGGLFSFVSHCDNQLCGHVGARGGVTLVLCRTLSRAAGLIPTSKT
jgi:hypothetical protein